MKNKKKCENIEASEEFFNVQTGKFQVKLYDFI